VDVVYKVVGDWEKGKGLPAIRIGYANIGFYPLTPMATIVNDRYLIVKGTARTIYNKKLDISGEEPFWCYISI